MEAGVSFGHVIVSSQSKTKMVQVPDTSCYEAQGILLGEFSNPSHGISGRVLALNTKTLRIEDFTYDGLGPGTFLPPSPPSLFMNLSFC